ncbi:MAG TPA: sigma-70 family RNA polymerase sigma factor [Tepidisphaeraceae bacterium]|nr:sigma-70 family RNA polymerase sigma factor [Tepidisphaeraceae bacterium]
MSSLSGAQFEAELPQATDPRAAGPETDLFRRAQQGDRGAFGQVVVLFQDRIYNAVLRMVGDKDEARELTQETFTRALVKIDSFRGESGPYTWLFRIAMNLSISQLRKSQRHRTFSLNQGASNGQANRREDQASHLVEQITGQHTPDPAQAAEERERNEQVVAALGRLDAEYRAVLVMRDIEGFDYQQMAQVLDLPLGTLKSRLFRARLALRDELKGYMK